MAAQTYGLTPGRINKFKGQILSHVMPLEVLARSGRQIKMPKNSGDTYVARRWLPYGATATNPNKIFANATGDRGAAIIQAHLTQEGVTPAPDSIVPMDIPAVMQQYSCLYGFTDKLYYFYEDDIPAAMVEQVGERVAIVNEMIIYGALRASTNQYYGGSGTSIATVDGPISLPMLRRMTRTLQANSARPVNKMLSASGDYDSHAISEGYLVFSHTDLEQDIRGLTGFTPVEKYASGTPMPNEIGSVERFRFITSPHLPSLQDAGAAVGVTGMYSTTGANIDVYPFIVTAQDAWSQIAVRGLEGLRPTFLKPGVESKSDPFGQRGYAGTIWWKSVLIENDGWMAVGNVGVDDLIP